MFTHVQTKEIAFGQYTSVCIDVHDCEYLGYLRLVIIYGYLAVAKVLDHGFFIWLFSLKDNKKLLD